MSDDHFNYDQLMLDAHRELIRQVLLKVEQTGLPGEHHFFIIFSTTHQGTRISDRLRAQYPKEMTIVLQHQYSNLKILRDRFEIQLSFNRIPELLVIPFNAITGFVDPSVPFGLQLAGESAAGLENSIGMLVPGLPQTASEETAQGFPPGEAITDSSIPVDHSSNYELNIGDETEAELEAVTDMWESEDTSVPSIFSSKTSLHEVSADDTDSSSSDDSADIELIDDEDEDDTENANIVQLDAFRKKSK